MVNPSVKLMSIEEIKRRLVRMTGEPYVRRPNEITRVDVAKWFGIDKRYVRMHCDDEINDFWQYAYSVFFEMMDKGLIEIQFDKHGKKMLVRVATPAAPPKKKLRPFVDLATMTLRLDS